VKQSSNPPLPFEALTFDFIYGISILTHINELSHFLWIDEFRRILKPEGILFLTTQGNSFKHKLTPGEKIAFDQGRCIVRSAVKEGHRTFSSFQPIPFMEKLFVDFEVLKHITTNEEENIQDVWIVRKIIH
jgi:SAM-dependent methyltransferase